MHEFALYAQVPKDEQPRILQQLAGVTRMQPQETREVHLVFKAQIPTGLSKIPSAGGSQGVQQQNVQNVKNMLTSSLYYVQVVGEVTPKPGQTGNDVDMINGHDLSIVDESTLKWTFDFRDTPDPGKQLISSRLISKTPIDDGDVSKFVNHFGYDYVSRYLVSGQKFYDQDVTLFLYKVLQIPQVDADRAALDTKFLSSEEVFQELDGSGGYTLQASIEVVDGNNPELRDRATRQLLAMKETLKQAVTLLTGDRLALDTRMALPSRRV